MQTAQQLNAALLLKTGKKSALVAFILGIVFPGLGHMYAGSVASGLLWLIVIIVAGAFFIPAAFGLYLFSMLMAASAAQYYNIKLKKQIDQVNEA